MRFLFVILHSAERMAWGESVLAAAKAQNSFLLVASPAEAARYLAEKQISPSHVILDIGARGHDILPEIDTLAEQCEPGTRVVAVGDANDLLLYRELLNRGVIDYYPMPADSTQMLATLQAAPAKAVAAGPAQKAPAALIAKQTLVYLSAASGDGASTAAMNSAYALSQIHGGKTVLVDMDYQFGMVAKQLALESKYGIRDLFDFPERGVDATLIKHMVAVYDKLHVISAPSELRYLPSVSADVIRDLITILKQNYEYIVIDLPHVWLPWVTTAAQQADYLVLVSQLWLKSVSHASRMMRAMRELGIPTSRIVPVINRSGAKFKEAIDPKDFERVCNTTIRFTLSNDIKTIVEAESQAKTVMEMPASALANDIKIMVAGLTGAAPVMVSTEKRGGLFSLLKG